MRSYLVPLAVLLLLAALAASAVRMWGGDPLPPDLPGLASRDARTAPTVPGHEFAWLEPGYLTVFGASFAPEQHPERESYRVATRRGPATRDGWPLSVDFTWTRTDVTRVDLFITGSRPQEDLTRWDQSMPMLVRHDADGIVAQIHGLLVSPDARRFAVQVAHEDGVRWHVSGSLPQAPTTLGRLADRLAEWPVLRWLPDLR